ncbi:putative disease resistance protein RGA3 [Coffea arabica]|uniref:Disease resistance protein RGA3 n=1 Tax=Coffea arabica TaxID=13443 RepID=A0A6P6TAH1_COFAR|nr:putative disease resistance protein RGA3 [Coffea arabica]
MENLIAVATVENMLKRLFSSTNIDATELEYLGLDEELKKLRVSVSRILSFLADADQMEWLLCQPWLMELQDLVVDADHAVEELNYEVLRRKVEIPEQKKSKTKSIKVLSLSSYFLPSSPTVSRRKCKKKLRNINKKFEGIIKFATVGDEVRRILDRTVTDSPEVGRIVGRGEDVAKIVGILTMQRTTLCSSALTIEGLAGLGKTTLAFHVYNHSEISRHFAMKWWISAAGEFETRGIFKLILEELTENSVSVHGVHELVEKLQRITEGKRYLLVLDNLYLDDNFYDSFVHYISQIESREGNWWLITTRDATGLRNHPMSRCLPNFNFPRWHFPIINLSPLDEENCLAIFKEHAFGGPGQALQQQEIQPEIRRYILDICEGIPLAAKLLGSLLCMKADQKQWFLILKRLTDSCGDMALNSRLVFYQMPSSSLKKCFAYCSNFPKDHGIDKEQLVQLWIAEGLIEPEDESALDLEDKGYELFYILLHHCLLEAAKKDIYGNVTHCRVPDALYRLAVSHSRYDSIDSENPTRKDTLVRYLRAQSIEQDDIPGECNLIVHSMDGKIQRVEASRMLNVSTLILKSNISDDLLLNFKFLHVLNLSYADIEELSFSIGNLVHLRYVDLSGNRFKVLHESICLLYNLETLRLLECPSLKVLPMDISNLISLRHLHFYYDEEFQMPPKMGLLTSLRTLLFYNLGLEDGQGIKELGYLKNLRGKIVIRKLELVSSKEEAEFADLFGKILVYELEYHWSDNRNGIGNDRIVLEGLQPHPELKSLTIRNYMGYELPWWVVNMQVKRSFQLDNLMELRLINCKRLEALPMLGQMPFLQYLELSGLANVTRIGQSFYGANYLALLNRRNGIPQTTITVFPALKRLKLDSMPNLIQWMEAQVRPPIEVFPCLEKLTIQYCPRLSTMPYHFPAVKELKIPFLVHNSTPLANICSSVTTLTELCLYGISEVTCLPNSLFSSNPKLEILCISSCPNLTHVVPSFHNFGTSLRQFSINGCNRLSELPQGLNHLSCLESLSIEECHDLKSLPDEQLKFLGFLKIAYCDELGHLPHQMIKSAINLRSLRVSHCPKLCCLPLHLDNKTLLSSLWISNCPQFFSVPEDLRLFSSLKELRIGCFSDSVQFESFIRQGIPNLQELHTMGLYGLPQWTKLPHELQQLQALRLLFLSDFGIKALPNWLGKLSSLEELGLYRCKKLKDMPSNEAMKSLTKLMRLSIFGCPLVKKKCLRHYGPGSGWSSRKFELYTD